MRDGRTPSPEAEIQWSEVLAHLQAAIAGLPATDQLILNLRFVDGRTAGEIAEALEMSSQWHVYRRLKGILRNLEEELRARGVNDPVRPT